MKTIFEWQNQLQEYLGNQEVIELEPVVVTPVTIDGEPALADVILNSFKSKNLVT